jgi:ElaB/YqjD/DUF883 family membrane-anchored ribosome-binding protein
MVQEGRVGEIAGQPQVRADVEAIKSDLAALRAEVSNLMQDVVSVGKVRAGDAKQRISDAARSRLDQLGSAWEQASDQGKQLVENLQCQIEERPLTSLGVAFGAGLLLGALLRK